jgi:ABC-type multidrug transport system permease subunit
MKYLKSLDSNPYIDIRWLYNDLVITYHWIVNSIYVIAGLVSIAIVVYFVIGYMYYWYCEYQNKKPKL